MTLYITRGIGPLDRFNPHSHAGSDRNGDEGGMWWEVSIHTPTRGVTLGWAHRQEARHVSIHTPTRGVTAEYTLAYDFDDVSIHTPTRGVTQSAVDRTFIPGFQSTLPRGE